MKKNLLILGLILFNFVAAFAQMEVPIDPKVLYGKLDNGMTYYIRHNDLPKERADFYIAHNVGAVLEEDNQNGLAHFLEHMAFNGSTHFPGNSMISYMETIGVKFGVNLNAFTSFDRTVYNISNVPLLREGIIDTCLIVLHDWSGSLLLDPEEIDKERGVIREEMRTRGDANWRMMEKMLPEILPGSIYSQRNIIGTEEIILNFEPQTLRDFYEKWYRPDLQALIVVGDIDPEQILAKLTELFKNDSAPVNPTPRPEIEIADNDEPLVGIATDKEATYTAVSVEFKHDPMPKEQSGTIYKLLQDYMNAVVSGIMQERLNELSQQADPPFMGASVRNSLFVNTQTKESLSGDVYVKGSEIERGLKTITRELERVKQHGFNLSEYDRARTNIIISVENAFNEREKTQNSKYSFDYVNHFTQGGTLFGIEMEYNLISMMAPEIPLEAINMHIHEMIGDKNIVISLIAPENDVVLPSKEDLLKWFYEARSEEIQALEEVTNDKPLLAEIPAGGSIIKESKDDIFGTTNYTLSNGVKVVIKPTNFKDDEILMQAFSPGGTSLFSELESENISLYDEVSRLGKLGGFKANDLRKALAGKKVSVNTQINLETEGLSGSSNIKDFETMLQLIYLNFTDFSGDDDAYQSYIGRIKSALESTEANPYAALVDTINKVSFQNQVRNKRLKVSDLEKANYQTILDWRKDRFADASDFTFVFTGNIDIEESKSLITKYLGNLPSINREEKALPVNMDFVQGVIKNIFEKQMENPKATVVNQYSATISPTLENRIKVDMLQQILQIVYTEKVREDEGGTYGVDVSASIKDYPKGQTALQIVFETETEKAEHLNSIVHKEFKNITLEGPREEDYSKVKEFMSKRYQEQLQENNYWSSVISEYHKIGYNAYSDYLKTLDAVAPSDIQKVANLLLDSNNSIEVIMIGVK